MREAYETNEDYICRLEQINDELLAAAKETLDAWKDESGMGTIYNMGRAIPRLQAAIARAEEHAT